MSDINILKKYYQMPRTLFIGNQFELPTGHTVTKVVGLINLQPNVNLSKITVGGATLGNNTYKDLYKANHEVWITPNLDGRINWRFFKVSRRSCSTFDILFQRQKAFLQDFFIKIKNVCPADLPRELPPDRGLRDTSTRLRSYQDLSRQRSPHISNLWQSSCL